MSKYIDLAEQIIRDRMRGPVTGMGGESYALDWLDRNPDQVPGRTITESQLVTIYDWARNYASDGWQGRDVLAEIGITVIPDPEPTNTEKLSGDIESIKRRVVHPSSEELADALYELGWVKAPGADDDCGC